MTVALRGKVLHGLPKRLGSGVSRPTVIGSLRQEAQAFVQDIDRRIGIPIQRGRAGRARPLTDLQILGARPLRATAGARLAGRIETVYLHHTFAKTFGFEEFKKEFENS